jgi:hypothetical protein
VKGSLHGRLIRRSLGTTNWQIAAQKIAEIEAAGSVQPARAPITVAEAAERFLSEAENSTNVGNVARLNKWQPAFAVSAHGIASSPT